MNINAYLQALRGSKKAAVVLGTTFGLVSGAAGGYILASKRLEKKFEELSKKEIAEAKDYYKTLNKRDEMSTPSAVVDSKGYERPLEPPGVVVNDPDELNEFRQTVQDLKYHSPLDSNDDPRDPVMEQIVVEEEVTVIERNIFDDVEEEEEFDYEAEKVRRAELPRGTPYLITKDEFFLNENELEQSNLTYFEGDDVLLDEQDRVIPDSEGVVGDDNLERFGQGSDDPKIVYVRNERLGMEFEIIQSEGEYSKEVLGFETELKHSDRRHKVPKFRGDDG